MNTQHADWRELSGNLMLSGEWSPCSYGASSNNAKLVARRAWVGCGPVQALPNVTAHPSMASVPITVLLCDCPLLCRFNVAIEGLILGVKYWLVTCHDWRLTGVVGSCGVLSCSVSADSDESSCPREGGTQVHWHVEQVWSRTFPDPRGETSVHGMSAICTAFCTNCS